MYIYLSEQSYIYRQYLSIIQTSIHYTMKIYSVIHAVAGLYEGYSDTSCDWFPTKEAAEKHIDQVLEEYRPDEMCQNRVSIPNHRHRQVYVTMTATTTTTTLVSPQDMDHDDYVAENGDDCGVEVFRIIEVDVSRYEGSGTTEHMWLTWDQQDACVAWDYYPLCMSLVARVSSDVMDNAPNRTATHLCQLTEFISAVYYRNEAFIDIDDYTMHAFRIPKKLNTND